MHNFKKLLLLLSLFTTLSTAVNAINTPIITVLDFSTSSIAEGEMNAIVEYLNTAIFETEKFTVIDRKQRDIMLSELNFSMGGCSDESCQLEIGKLLSAEYIVVGDISKVGNRYIFNSKMLETETSKTVSTAKGLYLNLDELLDDIENIAENLCGITSNEEIEQKAEIQIELKSPDIEKSSPNIGNLDAYTKNKLNTREIVAISTLSTGIISAGLSGYLIYAAIQYKKDTVDPAYSLYKADQPDLGGLSETVYYETKYNEYLDYLDTFKLKSITSLVVAGVGVVCLGASVFLFFPSKQQIDKEIAFGFLPVEHGLLCYLNFKY